MKVVGGGSRSCGDEEPKSPAAWRQFRTPNESGRDLIVNILQERGWQVEEDRAVISGGTRVRLLPLRRRLPNDSSAIVGVGPQPNVVDLTVYVGNTRTLCR